jgi:hypothetical protein
MVAGAFVGKVPTSREPGASSFARQPSAAVYSTKRGFGADDCGHTKMSQFLM